MSFFRMRRWSVSLLLASGLFLLESFGPTAPRADAQGLSFDRTRFYNLYRQQFGSLTQGQVNGLNSLLDAIQRDGAIRDVRHVAYMLATVKHEVANRYQPIEEFGRGAGRPYGQPVRAPNGTMQVYYGRGYVQLTWLSNYVRMGQNLGMGNNLANRPSLALDPAIAYRIMSYGMRNGSFTGRKLSDYINASTTDYVNARRIINGTDRAQLIAGYARQWETILRGSRR